MAWTDKLRKASFRGVEFGVDTTADSGGRRGVTHEFPGRNDPYTEDLGRKARTYAVEGFLVGEAVIDDAKKLVEALEADDCGELVHPIIGTLQVLCTDYNQAFAKTEGRVIRFSMTFIEEGTRPSPETQSDPMAAVNDAVDGLQSVAEQDFQEKADMSKVPDSIADRNAEAVTGVLARLRGQLEAGNIGGVIGTVREIRNRVDAVIQDPQKLANLIKKEVQTAVGTVKIESVTSSRYARTAAAKERGNSGG